MGACPQKTYGGNIFRNVGKRPFAEQNVFVFIIDFIRLNTDAKSRNLISCQCTMEEHTIPIHLALATQNAGKSSNVVLPRVEKSALSSNRVIIYP